MWMDVTCVESVKSLCQTMMMTTMMNVQRAYVRIWRERVVHVISMRASVNVVSFLRMAVKNVPVREKKKSAVMAYVEVSVNVIQIIKIVINV